MNTTRTRTRSLTWRTQHALARLYEDEGRSDDADREYRAALATFEAARSSLQRSDSKLPFSNNASRIYDDYVHFLVARGKTDDALRWADYSRARTLAEGLGLLAKGASSGPPPLKPQQIARQADGTILFYWLGEKQSYLWAITPQKTSLFTLPAGSEIDAAVQRYRKALVGPQDILETASPDGTGLYQMLVAPAQPLLTKDTQVFVIPDGSLNGLNFETLLVPEPKLHYWIEDATIADASSLRLLAASHNSLHASKTGPGKLLLIGDAVSPNADYAELPKAGVGNRKYRKTFCSRGARGSYPSSSHCSSLPRKRAGTVRVYPFCSPWHSQPIESVGLRRHIVKSVSGGRFLQAVRTGHHSAPYTCGAGDYFDLLRCGQPVPIRGRD